MRKLLSLRHWIHLFPRAFRLLMSRRIPLAEKLVFLLPAALYWVLPDVMPFVPIDDITVTMLLAHWFVERLERKDPPGAETARPEKSKER